MIPKPKKLSDDAPKDRLYDLWRVREFPMDRLPEERVWEREDGRLYFSRMPDVETRNAVAKHKGPYILPMGKGKWYQRLRETLEELGQLNPVVIHAHLASGPRVIRGGSRMWCLCEMGRHTVDAIISLPRGVKPGTLGLHGEYVEPTHEGVVEHFHGCYSTRFDKREWDVQTVVIEHYEAIVRKKSRK